MLSESLASSIMTTSITGAGLVIAFYALIARMSDRIFENRFNTLVDLRKDLKEITNRSDAFTEKNLETTTSSLNAIKKEIKSIKTFPRYLGFGVALDFILFLVTALFSYGWFVLQNVNEIIILILFPLAVFLFLSVGIYGIFDVAVTVSTNFNKLTNEKEVFEKDVTSAQEGGNKIIDEIESIFQNMFVQWERTAVVKVSGITLFPDLVIPSRHNPKYLIEVIAEPSHTLLDNLASKYRRISKDNIKTIIVSAFKENDDYMRIAEANWDHVIDLKNLNEIKNIVKY